MQRFDIQENVTVQICKRSRRYSIQQQEVDMLVSAKEMLDKAKAGHYAVGHFNINNLEWTKSILSVAQDD